MENFSQLIGDRLIKNCSEAQAGLLKLCQIKMVVVEGSSALLVHCPNSWTENQLSGFLLIGNLGKLIHNLGIERLVLNNGEDWVSHYEWDETYFNFNGYFLNGDLEQLKIVNVPTIEELENMTDNQQ
ncbi:hypothetical protein [Myxosarcina sp. GI1]|uniref:hypothetical protein n=1 Tax=Myxosarcina sp. GI1 TaxID=1541065 RepID=UPI00055AEF68|nr:hypothetical protein [Myxosarcina sp. GI1]